MSHLNPRQPTPHGFEPYIRCFRCGTERPIRQVSELNVCRDREWCDRQAGRATGIDENGDSAP